MTTTLGHEAVEPTMGSTTTLVSVTYHGDWRLCALQILSVDRLLDHSSISKYIIVINDEGSQNLRSLLLAYIHESITPRLQELLQIITPEDLHQEMVESGWRSQQAIKLMIADLIRTDTYLLLDAKNHFIRPTSTNEFFLDGLPITVFSEPTGWSKYLNASLHALGVYSDELASEMMPSITPYMMLTNEVRELMQRMEDLHKRPFPEAFARQPNATEFLLYYAHLASKYPDIPYVNAALPCRTLFTKYPQDPMVVMSLINQASTENVPMFGLHRNRLPQLTPPQKEAIEALWRRNLLQPDEDVAWFMHST